MSVSRERDAAPSDENRGEQRLVVGSLGAPYGVRGWLKVHSWTAPPENIFAYAPWRVRIGSDWVTLKLAEGKVHGKGLVARLEGYDDRDAVKALVGAEIAIPRARFEAPEAGEYYWADLIGATVVTRAGQELGRVDHLLETGANDVLVVAGERERLIPFVLERYIIEVDVGGGRIVVDWDPED